jgi:long-chain acyl-CoA synthetase
MGSSMGIAEAIEKIIDNIGEVRPTLLFAVPRIFNRIYDGLNKRMNEAGGLTKKMFDEAMAMAQLKKQLSAQRKQSGWVDVKLAVLDKLVFSKVRDRFGGRLKYAFSGGAALSKEVAEFIDNVGIMVYEGYGLTETSPIATMNYPGNRKIGSVGKAIPGVTIEIDTKVTDDPKNGEIIVWGHNIMKGYYGLDEENEKVLLVKNGERGFRTGDMGYIDGEGFLHITGRIKEQYKLLNGKYVVPTPLEEQIKLSPLITNVMVYGDNREFNVALVVPDWDAVKKIATENGLSTTPSDLLNNERIIDAIREDIERVSSSFKQFEKVKKFALIENDFTIENGMLTPSLKVKRRAVLENFGTQLDKLYA